METIVLDLSTHHNRTVILLKFKYNYSLITYCKEIKDCTFSRTHKSWYLPYSNQNIVLLKNTFESIAILDFTLLTKKIESLPYLPAHIKTFELSTETNFKIEQFKNWMLSKRYSNNTIKTYTDSLKSFFKFFATKPIHTITNNDIVLFNNNYILKNKYSSSFQNQVVNAIKLFFKTLENRAIDIDLVHRPKRAKTLPNVLSKEEVKQLLGVIKNIKHKAMLSLIYSCGLRSGELINLKIEHIDSKRNLLIIKAAKGKKDRVAPLSSKTVELLRTYYTGYKPGIYLFEGQTQNSPYDCRSLQLVLKQSLAKTKINKPVTLHWLRHSYATHLLENGTDLRYIQEILGHSSSKTTEIYTHVSTKNIQNIISPFDSL